MACATSSLPDSSCFSAPTAPRRALVRRFASTAKERAAPLLFADWPPARIDLAMIVAQQDRPEEACHLGEQALRSGRLVPSNIWRASELDTELQSRFGNVPDV